MYLSAAVRVKRKYGYKQRDDGVPVRNKDTGRTVYVLPETLKKHPDKFKRVPDDKAGDPRWRGKSKPARKPDKPDKPQVPRKSPPAPIRPVLEQEPVTRTKPVTEVPAVKPTKEPKPSPPRRWKQLKKRGPLAAESVLRRYLEALEREA